MSPDPTENKKIKKKGKHFLQCDDYQCYDTNSEFPILLPA